MLVAGWKSRTMIDRYTKATAVERARASHVRLRPRGVRQPPEGVGDLPRLQAVPVAAETDATLALNT